MQNSRLSTVDSKVLTFNYGLWTKKINVRGQLRSYLR